MQSLSVDLLTIVVSVGVLWLGGVVGRRRFHARISRDGRRLLNKAGKGVGPEHFAALQEQLPQPVRRYLQFAGGQLNYPTNNAAPACGLVSNQSEAAVAPN